MLLKKRKEVQCQNKEMHLQTDIQMENEWINELISKLQVNKWMDGQAGRRDWDW